MRHFRFAIGTQERDAWVHYMIEAIRDSPASSADTQALIGYFEQAATMLVNQPG